MNDSPTSAKHLFGARAKIVLTKRNKCQNEAREGQHADNDVFGHAHRQPRLSAGVHPIRPGPFEPTHFAKLSLFELANGWYLLDITMVSQKPMFPLRLDEEDRALAEGIAKVEKLSMSDAIRRAIRAYAKRLGVTPPKPKKGERR